MLKILPASEPEPASNADASDVTVSADVSGDEWDAYVNQHPDASGNHLWAWRRVYESVFQHRTEYLAARRRGGSVAGVLPLVVFDHRLLGRFMVSLPFVNRGGVLASDPNVARVLLAEAETRARWHGLRHVELRHIERQFAGLAARRHKVTMTMALESDPIRAWDALDRKVRNQVRKAEKSDLTTEVGGAALLPEFYAVFAENMRDLGTPVYPRQWFEEILRRFPDRSRVFLVRCGRKAVAGAVTFAYRGSMEIPSASSLRSHRALNPNMLLYWRIMQQAISDGACILDFGRSTPGEGTFRFKEQWGATPGPMTWEYSLLAGQKLPDRSPSNGRFAAAIRVWQRLPLPLANAIGPRIVRYLP